MDRRSFLKFVALGIATYDLDVEKLLWVPGQKKIFLPSLSPKSPEFKIIALEMERILPRLQELFEKNDCFYSVLKK